MPNILVLADAVDPTAASGRWESRFTVP